MTRHTHSTQADKSKPPGKWWRIAKTITKLNNQENRSPPIKYNNQILLHPLDKAEALNNFFASISNNGENDDNELEDNPLSPYTLTDINITIQDIKDQLHLLKVNNPSGPDGLHPQLIKQLGDSLCKPLCILFNQTIQTGSIPSSWKQSYINPIYNGKGHASDPSNYRPISVPSCLSKMLEKIVFKYVFNHITRLGIISDNQSGFKPHDSTVNQLLSIHDIIVKQLDQGKENQIYIS